MYYLIQYLFILLFKNYFIIICLLATFNNAFCPSGCECNDYILTVICDFAGINAVPILLNPMLKSLTIKNSNGLKLDTFSINLYQELEYLELSDCQITSIPSEFISQMNNLKFLSLKNNKLKLIDDQMFGKEQQIEGEKFKLNLQYLDLSNNQIERITPKSFKLLSSLLKLNISFNNLHFIPENVFFGLKKLKLLDLTRNRISKLENLKIENNKEINIIEEENNLFDEDQLEELKFGGNLISEISPYSFQYLNSLKKLDLSSNLISIISFNSFSGLTQLKELKLDKNLLSSFENEPLNNNKINQNLQINIVNNFPQSLEVLDISGNAWMMIPLFNISSLKKLIMEEMVQLREIQENAFKFLPNLETLSIANSIFLSKIDQNAFGNKLTTKLIYLNLSNCQLANLPFFLLDWKKIKILKLEGNRWNCDCQLISFLPQILDKIKLLNNNNKQLFNQVLCKEPNEYFNIPIINFNNEKKIQNCENINILPSFLEDEEEKEEKLLKKYFIPIATVLSLLMSTSIVLLIYCLCCNNTNANSSRRGGSIRDCCCYSQKNNKNNSKNNNLLLPKLITQQQQVQLYSTGSTYTESLIYEKENGKGIKSLHCPFYECANCPKVLLPYQRREESLNKIKVSDEQNSNENSSSSSSSTGEEYYSSIVQLGEVDEEEEKGVIEQFHLSPPKSPPPPPPPIFSNSPTYWPSTNFNVVTEFQTAAPPYQLRNSNSIYNTTNIRSINE